MSVIVPATRICDSAVITDVSMRHARRTKWRRSWPFQLENPSELDETLFWIGLGSSGSYGSPSHGGIECSQIFLGGSRHRRPTSQPCAPPAAPIQWIRYH